jgi:hypothetical protein
MFPPVSSGLHQVGHALYRTWRQRSATSGDATTRAVSVVSGFPHGVSEICALLGSYTAQNGSF